MATALNNRTSAVPRATSHAAVVPAAAVWDPRSEHPASGRRNTYGARIRTLRLERGGGLTPGSAAPSEAPGDVPARSDREDYAPRRTPFAGTRATAITVRESSGRLMSAFVGTVCGLAIVGGSMFGLHQAESNAPINGYSAGAVAVASR